MRSIAPLIFVAASLFAWPQLASAAQFWRGNLHGDAVKTEDASVVVLSGEIKPGDLAKLIDLSRRDSLFLSRTVLLGSGGGDAAEAIRIGKFLKETHISVFVNGGFRKCASACVLIYLAATERSATPHSLGIHRPFFSPTYFSGLSPQQAEAKFRELSRAMKSYLLEIETPTYLIDRMFTLASTEVYWLNDSDYEALGERSNWWDQYLVSRCRADKNLERRALEGGLDDPAFARRYKDYSLRLELCKSLALHEQPEKALKRYQAETPRPKGE